MTKQEQDEMLEKFYPELEIETDKTVPLGEFIGGNEDVDLSEDEENDVAEADDGADDNPLVANDINNTHGEPAEEVLPPNDPIPVLLHKQKFGSLTDALDESKYVDFPPHRPKTYTHTATKKTVK